MNRKADEAAVLWPAPAPDVEAVARAAVALVKDGDWVGLGTGRAASAFIAALASRIGEGLTITAVPTSEASARQARALGIPLGELEEGRLLELTVDGADEVTPDLDLLKGRGGAMVRERIVAAASKRQVILIGGDKLVASLGTRGDVPVEVIPMARGLVLYRLKLLGMRPAVRLVSAPQQQPHPGPHQTPGAAFVTENANMIIDCRLPVPLTSREAAREMERALLAIPGVVDTGLFLGTCERVLVGSPDGRVDVLVPPPLTAPEGRGL